MRKPLSATALVLLACLLAAAPAAANATEMEFKVGSECTANDGVPNATLAPREGGVNVQRLAVPLEGVLTQWQVRFAPPEGSGSYPETLKVLRLPRIETYGELQVVAESARETVVPGPNTFKTRIPVKAGDVFGLWGGATTPTLFCSMAGEGERMALNTSGELEVGTVAAFQNGPVETQVPILATVEADVDGDGYGDVTQDRCPASALYHGPCPRVSFHAAAHAADRAALVQVSASSAAEIMVAGQVSWRVRQPGGKVTGLTAGLGAGAKTLAGQGTARFRLPYGKPISRRLGRISPSQSLKARLTVTVTDLAGRVKTRVLHLRIPGRA